MDTLARKRFAEIMALKDSALRDAQPTLEFGARVMNEVVIPRSHQINKNEMALDALKRWMQEREKLILTLKEYLSLNSSDGNPKRAQLRLLLTELIK
jgi:hypothetical protein